MMRFGQTRSRALLLLLVFGVSLTGQIMAGAMAAPMGPRGDVQMSAAQNCPGCDNGMTGAMSAQCGILSCWNFTAIAVDGLVVHQVVPIALVPTTDIMVPGLTPGPDPHPPRFLLTT